MYDSASIIDVNAYCGEAPIAIDATYTFLYVIAISPRSFLFSFLPLKANLIEIPGEVDLET